jgi:uncharacterized protein
MTIHQVCFDSTVPQPWRNGGGRTRELLAWPGRDDWQLRISVADIDRDGPFSPFPGVERWFAVLEGEGVRLQLPGGAVSVTTDRPPLHFHGEDAPGCELIAGPTRDLNLMVRRGHGAATMQRAEPGVDFQPHGLLCALFSADPVTLQVDDVDAHVLAPLTLLWSTVEAHARWPRWRLLSAPHLNRPRAWWICMQPMENR